MNPHQAADRGYLWCSPSCVCEMCIAISDWISLLRERPGLRVFKDEGKLPGPAEFRARLAEEAA